MFELLHQKITETVSISDEDFEFCKTLFQPKKLRKIRFILGEGDVCKYTIFLEKGLLRSFKVDEKGAEHVLQFSLEGWWCADLYSFFTGEPSNYNIEALEDSELFLITKTFWDLLLERVLALSVYFLILITYNIYD